MIGDEISPELKAKYGDRLAALSPAQRALLERAMKKSEERVPAPPAPTTPTAPPPGQKIPRRAQPNFCPLSIDQERLWFVQQLNLESPIYNIYQARRYRMPIAVPVLARAVDHVVSRYEILRTTFPAIDGRAVMQIAPELSVGMPWIDLRGLPFAARQEEADRVANEAVRRPFSLLKLPLFRMLLIQLAADDFIWPIAIHHIITDWIAFYIFEEEIRSAYAAFLAGEPPPFPEPRIQYADYTVWQRERLMTHDLGDQIAYWQNLLRGVPETVPLPIDRPRPPVQSPVGGRRRVMVAQGPADRLRALAQKESTTPFVVLLAVLKTLLVRLSGQEQVIVGTPMSHRLEPETQEILGFFLSQLIYFSDYRGNPSFREAVRRERQASIAAYAHSEVPFSKIVESLGLERDLSRTPFFQIQLLLLNSSQAQQGAEDGPGAAISDSSETYWVDARRTQSELAPIFWESDTGLTGFLEYNVGIFEAPTIDRLKEQLRVLLAAAVARPETPLWSLPLLPESQRHQLLVEWAGGDDLPFDPAAGLLHAAFEERAAAAPEAPAVIAPEGTVTYGELDRRAARLAHHLATLGVGPETAVVVAVERTAQALVALLGVLKAGGVYVPVEPATPADRARFLIRDTGAPVVLVGREAPWETAGARIVRMADEPSWAAPAAAPPPAIPPAALAYVIYTSGSTGEPKGVAVAHGPAAAYFRVTARDLGARPGERCLLFSIFSFDAALEQVFSTLSGGGTLVLRGEEVWEPERLGEVLDELEVAVTLLPPSYWGRWVESLPAAPATEPAAGRALRQVMPGGEAMAGDWVRRWQASEYGQVPLYNLYGPTETLVAATAHAVPAGYRERGIGGSVPIGRALPGRTTHVVDPRLNPLPAGVPGELVIGGPLLARGYLDRPGLTAASFVPDPFTSGSAGTRSVGGRLYRTGDRVRTLPDGALEFLGRIDSQVKVHGFRIELGEIEAALLSHPAVGQAAVAVRGGSGGGGGGGARLVAYVVPEDAQSPTAAELREALRTRLPEYMVPGSFVTVAALPCSASGKVDRRALLALPEGEERGAAEAAAPRTPAERILVAIWKEVLHRGEIGIHDNFFSLGGDSILSIQVIARAQRAGLKLAPRLLFQHQTIAELALVAAAVEAVDAPQGPVTGPVPFLPITRWYFGTAPVDPHHFNLAVLFETAVRLQPLPLARTLALLELHHDALRLRIHRGEDGEWRQEIAPPERDVTAGAGAARWPLSVVDLTGLPDAALSPAIEAAAAAAQTSLDLARGPLYRSLLFDTGGERPGRLFWTVNHLAIDGVSWRILLDDLATCYATFERTGTADLPPKTTSLKQWAERLAAHAGSDALAAEAAYWRGLPWEKVAALPVDFPRPEADEAVNADGYNSKASERSVSFDLPPEATRQLLEEVHAAFNTRINDVLLAAFARALADWTGSQVVLLDLESHGREGLFPDVDLSRTVGWLTSAWPVLFDLSQSSDPIATLKNVKEHLRTVPGNGLGYGLLRHPPEGPSRLGDLPLAQVAFNYLGQLDLVLPEGAPFQMAEESGAPQMSRRGRRPYLLEWMAEVYGGALRVTCAYSTAVHGQASIERLADSFRDRLLELIELCLKPGSRGFTPSDFAAAQLSQKDLDKFLGKLGQKPGRK